MISLDLRTLLPLTRQAYDQHQLQAQVSPGCSKCSYQGPCAIGVGLTPEQQVELDNAPVSAIRTLIFTDAVVVPGGQVHDFFLLQQAHDRWAKLNTTHLRTQFEALLKDLEAKYVAP